MKNKKYLGISMLSAFFISTMAFADVPNLSNGKTGDGNGDGLLDNEQADVSSLLAADQSTWLTYRNSIGAIQENFVTATSPHSLPANFNLPYGTVQYEMNSPEGAEVRIEVYVSKNTEIYDYLLLGNDGTWETQSADISQEGFKTKLSFSVKEGGNFDRDGKANGTLQLATGGIMVKSGFSIWPRNYLFAAVDVNNTSPEMTFTIRNTGSRPLKINRSELSGIDASSFLINNDNCSNQSLLSSSSCTISASFTPKSIGKKAALLTIHTDDPDNESTSIFLHNDESTSEEAPRRLPPVLSSLHIVDEAGNPVESMKANTTYSIEWSILGYHKNYQSLVAMFDCADIIDETTCGSRFSDNNRFVNSGAVSPLSVEAGTWQYKSEQSKLFSYRYQFTTPDVKKSTPIVIRLYRINEKDYNLGGNMLSLIIPGNHAKDYYDTSGRRIKNTINP